MEKKVTTPTDLPCRRFSNEFSFFLNYNRTLTSMTSPTIHISASSSEKAINTPFTGVFNATPKMKLLAVAQRPLQEGVRSSRKKRIIVKVIEYRALIPVRRRSDLLNWFGHILFLNFPLSILTFGSKWTMFMNTRRKVPPCKYQIPFKR